MRSFQDTLREIENSGLLRELTESTASGAHIRIGDRSFLNLACNDYLGLSSDISLQREFLDSLEGSSDFIMGGVSSRLLGGDNPAFEKFEETVGNAFSESGAKRYCLMLNSGYHANTGIIPALASRKDLVVCDKLVHASIIDSLRLCDAKWLRFPHNDLTTLREILSKTRDEFDRVFIVTEAVFSMDGDRADLRELVEIKNEFDAFLYVDEAHSFGVFGDGGLGLSKACGVVSDIDVIMCTLGKAMASVGAFAICSSEVRHLLINKCRPFIFTTALAPINALWSLFVFNKFPEMKNRRDALVANSCYFRKILPPSSVLGDTQIVPFVVGENSSALMMSEKLRQNGIFAPAVRHPSVPKGSARIRMSLNAEIDKGELERCAAVIGEVYA